MKRKVPSDVCEIKVINKNKIKKVKRTMATDSAICRLSETFKVLGDPTRTKIIFALSKEELCVCDITHLLGVTLSAVSHQLRMLRNLRLVKYRKEGKRVFYSLDDKHIENLFAEGLKHVKEIN